MEYIKLCDDMKILLIEYDIVLNELSLFESNKKENDTFKFNIINSHTLNKYNTLPKLIKIKEKEIRRKIIRNFIKWTTNK